MKKTEIIINELEKMKTERLETQLRAEKNLERARLNKTFLKYEKEMRQIQMEISKLPANDEKVKELYFKLRTMQDSCSTALKSIGMSYRDTTPQYKCKLCNDIGIVNGKKCQCLLKRIQDELVSRSGIGSFSGHSFKDVNPNFLLANADLNKAYKVANAYITSFPNFKYKNLVFCGEVGTGKTFLLECIASELIKRTNYVVFVTSFDLNNIVIRSMSVPFAEREDVLDPLLECDLLIIDDLGSEAVMKNVSINNLYTIINQRQRNNLNTIISTNLTPPAIKERYGDRLVSRIFNRENTLAIPFKGKDLRIQ